jgi:TPP-dependent pyruvate/acetoin dehydrogenase alpha subunit
VTTKISTLKDLYLRMLRIRMIEEEIARRYPEEGMRCPVHLSIGQEAIAVGVCAHLSRHDQVTSAHRSHGHYLAQGGDLFAMLSELHGKATGCCGGRGGSMHLIDRKAGFVGAVPIVGSTLPIGVGLAWGAKTLGTGVVTVIFFGEGATEEGVFSESLNLACLYQLPVIFVCEDNGFSVYTDIKKRRSLAFRFPEYFRSHGADCETGDGMNVEAVYRLTGTAIDRVRDAKGPQVLYFKTWRYREHCGHREDDDLDYRDAKDIARWKHRDPIVISEKKLNSLMPDFGRWSAKQRRSIGEEIAKAFKEVRAARPPHRTSLKKNLFAGMASR